MNTDKTTKKPLNYMYDKGYAAAVDDYGIAWKRYPLEDDEF